MHCSFTEPEGNGYRGSYLSFARVTEEQLKGYASNLGVEYFIADTTGINNGFPILKWQLEKIQN